MALSSKATTLIVIVVGLVAAALGGGIGREAARSFLQNTPDPTSQAVLSRIASEVNKSAPMMVDKETELMNTLGLEGVMVYNYRLVNVLASEIDADELVSQLQPETSRSACTTPQTRDALLKRGVTMRFAYSDRDRVYITAFDVTPTSCGF